MLAALLNTTTPETKAEEALGRISDVFDYMTFVATLICLMFFLTRTLVSFPYNGLWKRPFSLSDFVSRIHSECYLFARPVARLLCVLVFTEFMSTFPEILVKILDRRNKKIPMGLCFYQGFSTQFWGFASHAWCLMVAVWMFWILVLEKRKFISILEAVSHLYAWGITIVLAIIPISMRELGQNEDYCWITNETRRGKFLRFGAFYIPLWISILLVCLIYLVTIVVMLKKQVTSFRGSSSGKKKRHIAMSMSLYIKLLGFPLFYVILWVFPTFRRISEAISGNSAPLWLKFLHSFNSLQGFWHTVIYLGSELVGSIIDRCRASSANVVITETNLEAPPMSLDYSEWEESMLENLDTETNDTTIDN